jgi:hypothetical protein
MRFIAAGVPPKTAAQALAGLETQKAALEEQLAATATVPAGMPDWAAEAVKDVWKVGDGDHHR